jgi:hypothetical protein
VGWGANNYGQCTVPPLPSGTGLTYVEIEAGPNHALAGRSDGSVVAWGDNGLGQCNAPAPTSGLAYGEVAAGYWHAVAWTGLAATANAVGIGCGVAGMPLFNCNALRIGQNVTLLLSQGTPNASRFIYYNGVPAAPIALGSGCTVELDLVAFGEFLPVATNPKGAWSGTLSVPFDQQLVGLQGALQFALVNTLGQFGIDLSNGLIVTIGY